MPVSVVCEATANVNAALRESLGSANACTVTSAAVGDDVKVAIVSANGAAATTITNTTDVCDNLQNKLVASAKIALFTKIEYEEATNYSHSVLDNLKSKYHVLKSSPPSYNGEINRNSQMTIYNQSENSSADINGNTTTVTPTTISSSNSKLRGNANELPQPKRILYPRENVQIGWEATGRSWKVGVGMINVGNTCYLNSTLQALFHVPSMANWLISDSSHIERCDTADTGCIICAMIKTLIASQNSISSIRPYCVYSKLKSICKHLVMGRQEDAHEFLRYLVEAMEKAYLSRFRHFKELDQFSKETTPLNQILGGYLKSAVRCLACNHISVTFQHFQDLLLDIRKADTIEEALEGYFSRERLEDMGYRCEACKKKVSATKQFTLERAPIVLCIQLKRFSMLGTKLNKQITLTPKLDLTKYASKQCTIDIDNRNEKQHAITYRLVAMVTHLGASQHCGHYTAIGLTKSGTYYNYDDSYVRPISMQNVCNTNAYIIFYEMDSQPLYAMSQQQQQQQQQIACTQISNISSNSAGDVAQTIKINGHPNVLSNCNSNNSDDNDSDHENSQTQQRIIGPQLPPSKLGNYGGSTITTSTTTTIATIATNASTNLLTNSNKLSVNSRCSNSLSSSGASSSLHNISNNSNNSNNSKIMIHFKNNNNNNNNNSYVSNTATVNSIKTSTTTCSSTMPTAPVSTIISSSNNNNNNNNNNNSNISSINKKNDSNTPASCNYSSHYKNESLIKTAASTKLTTVAATTEAAATTTIISKLKSNKRSFCSSSSDDNDDDENDQTTLIAAPSPASASPTLEIISIQKVGSQNTLPSMPKLNVDATAIKTTATTSTTNLSSNSNCNSSSSNLQKQKPAITNENNKKSSASLTASSASAVYTSINTSPFKSLVPYGSSETDEESDYAHANINNASLRQTNRDQTSQYQQQQLKRLQSTTNPLKRRFNSINTNQLQQQQRANTSSSNGSGSGSGSGSGNGNGNGSNSDHDADDDDDHDDHDNNNSSLRVKVKQKKITDFCAKAAKRKLAAPINSIDEIFNSVKLNCNSSSNGDSGSSNTVTQTNGNIKCMKKSSKCLQEDQQQKIVMLPSLPSTAALPDLKITILSSSSSEEDYDDDECKTDGLADEDKSPLKNNCNKKISPLKRPQSTTPSPPLIKTKTGLWQVTLLSPETLKKANNKINNNAKGGIENKAPTEKSSKFLRNPFATNTIATTTTTTAGTGKSTNRLSATSKANNLNTNNLSSGSSKRLKKVATSSSSSNLPNSNGNTKTFNGYGYQRESASDSAINELLKQSHQGYGAPVLTWNGQQADIEKEIINETRAERQRDWQTSDEDKNAMGDNHNGRQKKTKTSRSNGIGGGGGDSGSCSGMGIRPSGYNPFQEHQDNLKRWKQRYQHHQYHHNHHNHNHNQHARHYNHSNGTASSTSHFRHNFQRNKFKFQRFPYKFAPNANINRHNSNSINGSSGVSGSNTSDCANNNINTPGNNLNYRRDS